MAHQGLIFHLRYNYSVSWLKTMRRYPEEVTFQPRVNSNSAATARLAITSPETQLPVEQRCGTLMLTPIPYPDPIPAAREAEVWMPLRSPLKRHLCLASQR